MSSAREGLKDQLPRCQSPSLRLSSARTLWIDDPTNYEYYLPFSPALVFYLTSSQMAWIDTIMGYEYDRMHSDAVYEPTSNVETDEMSPRSSSRGRGGSEVRPAVQCEMNEPFMSDTHHFGSQSQEDTRNSPFKTISNRSSANAKRASATLGPEYVGPSPNKSTFHAFTDCPFLRVGGVGLLLLVSILFVWYFASE